MRGCPQIAAAISANVKARRQVLGLSLDEVARRSGMTKSHVWEIEQGRSSNPTITSCLALCEALSLPLNGLLGRDVSQPILTERELEMIAEHRRIFGRLP